MKNLTLIVVAVTLMGCGTAQQAQIDQLNRQVKEMQEQNASQRKYIATITAAKTAPPAPAPVQAPAAPAQTAVIGVGAVSSLVYQQPIAYHCFVGEGNPGFGGGNWVKIRNLNPKYDVHMSLNGRVNQGGTSIIVMVPRPGMRPNPRHPNLAEWMPYTMNRPGVVTVLPAMSSCHLSTPDRLDDNEALKEFSLFATAFQPTLVPQGNMAVRHWSKASVLKSPREFMLYGQQETVILLQWYDFI